ncbi:heat shock 70 kDa protein 12A [Venturia nashicola]|uniref:Heat shock 70 kDa protein 12A n=1 Tax=Venturia nashicola TaxID=86259 RepID=A0A4Z1NR87_9PEZI|nr:heat shock 70 kDa protein 12A [Venturia nashicola]TLD28115.1 heat shock 70 kDa protein 12A [Venturia nashicola]
MSTRHRYIVGLDFGTTYTGKYSLLYNFQRNEALDVLLTQNLGISHVDSTKSKLEDIQVIRNWPGPSKEFDEVWKTPSKIAYRADNTEGLDGAKARGKTEIWGYQVTPGMDSYSWMKLLLDKDTKLTKFDDSNLLDSLSRLSVTSGQGILQLPYGKTATEVCSDFLQGIYEYTMSELERIQSPAVIKITPIEFWVTVPATWSDKAKKATKNAALRAGFGSRKEDEVFMITEPEAAAVATLSSLNIEGVHHQIKPGDGILVCDCGGGTVDINTYIIKSTQPHLEFEELVTGLGGKVGSTFIDRQFHHWMSSRFGQDFDNLPAKKKGPGSRFMKEFESLKRDFGGTRNAQMKFEVPLVMKSVVYSTHYDMDECMVKFTKTDMESFFKPSISKILDLLEEQTTQGNAAMPREKKIKTIILVGGFGDSQYLNDALRLWCKHNGGLTLICPPHPQAAIVKGAALRGLGGIKPSLRRCRRHYGFSCAKLFRENIDPEHRSYFSEWDGRKFCSGRLSWQIAKGAKVTEDTFISSKLNHDFWAGDEMKTSIALYSCNTEDQPEYGNDISADRVDILVIDFSDLSLANVTSQIKHGKTLYEIRFDIEVLLGAKEGVLRFRAKADNKIVGEQDIDFSKN